jgi:hypothetical protein
MAPANKQGQYLAFIYAYTRLHRRPPAEADMQQYFRVSHLQFTRWCTLERAAGGAGIPGIGRATRSTSWKLGLRLRRGARAGSPSLTETASGRQRLSVPHPISVVVVSG